MLGTSIDGRPGGKMKGMFDLLERAGLVRRVEDTDSPPAIDAAAAQPSATTDSPAPGHATAAAMEEAAGMSLDQVYAAAGVPPCAYPAERLLRLIDGLKAMDEATRRQAIHAIDAADDSWSIDDPKRDAAAKVAALERHAASIRAGVAQAEQETQARQSELKQRQETSVAEIRRQIADLEGLLAREIARAAQEQAALEAALQSQREGAGRELGRLSQTASALTGLIAQFSDKPTK
jgi:hypothetical protein